MVGSLALARSFRCALDPAYFAQSVGVTPDPWQSQVLRSSSKRILLNCSRQSGKSTVSSIKGLHRAIYRPRSLVLILSPSERQSSELFRKLKEAFGSLEQKPKVEKDSALSLEIKNGSRVVALPGAEKTVRSYSGVSLAILDEASRVDDALYRAIRPMLAVSHGDLMALSTPFGKRGFFHEEWTGVNKWERYQVPATMCPRIDAEFLAEELAALGPLWFSQEYETVFADLVSSLFSHEEIQNAFTDRVKPLPSVTDWLASITSTPAKTRSAITANIPVLGGGIV